MLSFPSNVNYQTEIQKQNYEFQDGDLRALFPQPRALDDCSGHTLKKSAPIWHAVASGPAQQIY